MTKARVGTTSAAGFEGVVLENGVCGAVVVPSLGGRVWELWDTARNRQWVWHRPNASLAASAPGSPYDDVWAGGWEELFPNDSPGEFEGRVLNDHGEWWTTAWSVSEQRGGDEAVLRLSAETATRRTRCEKEFRLRADSASMLIRYSIQNLEDVGFHFLFKEHLPIGVTPACTLAIPGGRFSPVDAGFGNMIPGAGPYAWPFARGAEGELDMRQVPPPSSGLREFVYVESLDAGWCGVDDSGTASSLRLHFDLRKMPFVWLFLAYGGWRGCYTAVLEPCTNMPKELSEAARLGRSAYLPPRGQWGTEVKVTLSGLDEVDNCHA